MSPTSFTPLAFGRTKHFAERQKNRSVNEDLLKRALSMCTPRIGYTWLIVTRRTLKRLAPHCRCKFSTQEPLIIVLDHERLVTCYYSKIRPGILPSGHQVYFI